MCFYSWFCQGFTKTIKLGKALLQKIVKKKKRITISLCQNAISDQLSCCKLTCWVFLECEKRLSKMFINGINKKEKESLRLSLLFAAEPHPVNIIRIPLFRPRAELTTHVEGD